MQFKLGKASHLLSAWTIKKTFRRVAVMKLPLFISFSFVLGHPIKHRLLKTENQSMATEELSVMASNSLKSNRLRAGSRRVIKQIDNRVTLFRNTRFGRPRKFSFSRFLHLKVSF